MLLTRCRSWFEPAAWRRLIALFAAIGGGVSILFAQAGSDEPAVPIQRIFLQPDRAAKELEKIPQGTLLAFPRQDFEDRLERVRRAIKARAQKPRLTRAHYSAELIDRAFANGSGQWTLLHPGADAALLPIDPLNLAFSKVKWDDGSDAILAEFDGKSLGLLVKPVGNPTCWFDWSARGTPINDGIEFHLAVPFCALTTFEFRLPADYWLSVPKGAAVVTGPHDTETPAKRLWKMQITGTKPIDITVRRLTQPKGPAPTIFARVENTQQLAHDRIAVEQDFQIDVVNGSVRELILEGSSQLQPYHVAMLGAEVAHWQWKEIAGNKNLKGKVTPASGMLTIQFPQPVQGKIKSLQVKSLCAPTTTGTWTSPALQVCDSVSRGEVLQIRLQPDVAVGRWDHGTFQPTNLVTEPDGAQILTLAETAADNTASRRPTMILPIKNLDVCTTESCQWRIDPSGADLNAEIQYALTLGQLFELRLRLPAPAPRYQIETLEMQPAEMLRGWRIDGNVLVVDLKQPLTSARRAVLRLHLRTPLRGITAGPRDLAYPELEPLDSTRRQRAVSVYVDPIFLPTMVSASVPAAPLDKGAMEKNGDRPSYRFVLRDQRLNAILRVVPQPTRTQLRGKYSLTLSDQHALLRQRWEVQPIAGEPEFLDFRCAPGFPSWKVLKVDGALKIHHWERLSWQESLPCLMELGAPTGLNAIATASMAPPGALWRFHLAEPLRSKGSFTVEAILPKSAGGKIWSAPLMTPVQDANVDDEIVIHSPDEPISKWSSDAAFETLAALAADKAVTNLTLRQTGPRTGRPASITLWTNRAKRAASQLELCDEARLSSYVYRDGRIYHRLQFRLWHWRNPTCDLKLPADWQVLSVKIHDRWLDRLETESSLSEVRLVMPFDQNGEYVRYEILARSVAGHAFWEPAGWQEILLPEVHWPANPLEVRTRVFLEDGLTPLDAASLSPVGVPRRIAERTETPRWLRHAWTWGQAWLPIDAPSDVAARLAAQRNGVLLAEAKFRNGGAKPMKLAEALERFALDHLKDATPLVIDRMALRSLGLGTETPVSPESLSPQAGRPFWEKLGLVYVSCPSGAVLTSALRLQSLGIDANDPAEAAELDDAVKEAILHGRDASAGFYLVPAWLGMAPEDRSDFTPAQTAGGFTHPGDIAKMTPWELRPEGSRVGSIVIVDAVNARMAGALMALLAAFVAWKAQRALRPVLCFSVYLLVMAGGAWLVVWSAPAVREFFLWPTSIVVFFGALGAVVRVLRQGGARAAEGSSTINHPATTAAMLGLAVLGATWSVAAQTPAARSYPVFVIDGAKPRVLIGPDLMARLNELENQPALGPAGAVLVRAKYAGKVKDSQAKIDVLYEIYSIKDKAELIIPLAGVQLGEGAFLDGTPVFLAPHKSGYTLSLRGKGPHHLRLSFSVAVRTAPKTDQLDLQFTAPKLSQNEIALQWQVPVQTVHSLRGWGEEVTHLDPRQAVKAWQAQLGYENEFHLRWSSPIAPTAAKTIEVKEAHFWDLRPGSLSLLTTFNYAIGKGSVGQLVVSMPEELQVRTVEALAPLPALAAPIVVKHWTVTGKGPNRRLYVELARPATGNVTLNLEMAPRAFGQKAKRLLPLPVPLQGKSTGIVGYRMNAAEVRSIAQNLVAVQSISVGDFEQQWKKQSGPPLPPATRAKSFQRTNLQPAALELWIEPSARQSAFHLNWDIDRHFADLHGKLTVTSSQQDLVMLECFVDSSMTLADVFGEDVRRWHRQDSLLQVWLKQPRKETSFKITGWRKSDPNQESFVLPCIYPLDTLLGPATVTVNPAPGIQLRAQRLRGLHVDAADPNRLLIDKSLKILTRDQIDRLKKPNEKLPYSASFLLSAGAVVPDATMFTKVQVIESRIEASVHIRLLTQRGPLPGLKVHLQDWDEQPWQLDAPGASVQRSQGQGFKHAIWTLRYPPGMPQEVFITLSGRVTGDLPVVAIEGAALRGHWLAWRGVEIQSANQAKPIINQRGLKDKLTHFQPDAWLKQAPPWNVAEAPKSIRAMLPKRSSLSNGRVLASAEVCWLSEEREWLHEATFWVQAEERTDLRFKFPGPLAALNAWTDGHPQSVTHPAAVDYVLALGARSTPQFVMLRWKYADHLERAGAPNIAALQIDQLPLAAHERLVWIPAGLVSAHSGPWATPTFPGRLLHQAQEYMEMAAALGQESARSKEIALGIAAQQRRFYSCLRQAEYGLSLVRNADSEFDLSPLLKRLRDLKDRNAILAKERHYEDQRTIVAKSPKTLLATAPWSDPERGGTPLLLSPNLPNLTLQSIADQQTSQQRSRSEWVLLAAIFLFVFSYFRHGWSVLTFAVPEIVIGLLVVAMVQFGFGLIGVALVASMAMVRFLRIAAALRKRTAQESIRPADAQPSTNGQPPATP